MAALGLLAVLRVILGAQGANPFAERHRREAVFLGLDVDQIGVDHHGRLLRQGDGGLGRFVVGEQLRQQGIWATVLSMAAILIYIGVRFQISFGVGAIVATIHDLLVTIAFLAFFQYDLSLNVIAAILTITGYSTNDTIVIFDRVRENSRLLRRDPLDKVVNLAVNQTLGRTVITAGTTFFSVLALYLFGGEVLEGFAFAMLVGIVSGTYSTVFIAAALAILLSGRKTAAGRAAVPVEEAVAERPRKGGRNVRVS